MFLLLSANQLKVLPYADCYAGDPRFFAHRLEHRLEVQCLLLEIGQEGRKLLYVFCRPLSTGAGGAKDGERNG